MAQITLYCGEAHALKLGPGVGLTQTPGQLIVFERNHATFDEKDFPDWRDWLAGAPFIEVLEGDEIAPDSPDAHVCPTCGKAFPSKAKLNGHRMSHRPKAEPAPEPKAETGE